MAVVVLYIHQHRTLQLSQLLSRIFEAEMALGRECLQLWQHKYVHAGDLFVIV